MEHPSTVKMRSSLGRSNPRKSSFLALATDVESCLLAKNSGVTQDFFGNFLEIFAAGTPPYF
jgi:hypothetical protein